MLNEKDVKDDLMGQNVLSLIRMKLGATVNVSESFYDQLSMNVGFAAEFLSNQIVFHFESHLAGEDLGICLIKYPDGWWNALRDRFDPEWLRLRYPIKYIEMHMHSRVIYPELELPSRPRQRQIFQNDIVEIYES